jgi:hypothetical protein
MSFYLVSVYSVPLQATPMQVQFEGHAVTGSTYKKGKGCWKNLKIFAMKIKKCRQYL